MEYIVIKEVVTMDNNTCPFISQSCCKHECRFWNNEKNNCIIKVVSEITIDRHEFMDKERIFTSELKRSQTLENETDLGSANNCSINIDTDSEIGSY
jgi:hypothetical protein